MRLADRLAAAAEQSDVQQVGGYLAQVQQPAAAIAHDAHQPAALRAHLGVGLGLGLGLG